MKLPNVCFNRGLFDYETCQCGHQSRRNVLKYDKMIRAYSFGFERLGVQMNTKMVGVVEGGQSEKAKRPI